MEQLDISETLTSIEVEKSPKSKKSQKKISQKRKSFLLIFSMVLFLFIFFCGLVLAYKYFEQDEHEPLFLSSKKVEKNHQVQEKNENKNENEVIYRFAEKKDLPFILKFIHELAIYEKLPNIVTATEEALNEWLFEKKGAEVLLVVENGIPAGHAFIFTSFCAFIAKPGIYLDHLFVMPEHRGKKYGEGLLRRLGQIVLERGYGRLEWRCLTWNTPSYDFYLSFDAKPLSDYVGFRVEGEVLKSLANLNN